MNKTININLGGIFFHIDEIAYQKLKRYIESIRQSLSDDPQGKDEIIKDIESRISELLSERVKDARQVVNESDIDEVIVIMGQPEDYMVDEELFNENSGNGYAKKTRARKFFRDSEDKFLGGVSSGIAHYFGIEAIWVRLGWLVLAFSGFGFFVYPILWILLPEARTTAEKLQMEGEPVNITNIEKKIREEFEEVSVRVKGVAGEVSDVVKDEYHNLSSSIKKKKIRQNNARSGIQEIIDVLGKILTTIFMVLGKFIGVLLTIISVVVMLTLVISLFTAGAVDYMGVDSFFGNEIQVQSVANVPVWIVSVLLLILVGIPFLMLFFLGIFILSSKTRILSRTTKFVLLGIWILALLGAIYIGLKQAKNLSHEGYVIENVEVENLALDTLSVKMIDNEMLSNYTYLKHRDNYKKIIDSQGVTKHYSNDIRVQIKRSDSAIVFVKIKKEALGPTTEEARLNAKDIVYKFQGRNNILNLDGYFLANSKKTLRNLEVQLTLYIPEGMVLYLEDSMSSFLKHSTTVEDMYRSDMAGHYFEMTTNGLKCLDCTKGLSDDDDFWEEEKEEEKEEENTLNIKINGQEVEVKIMEDNEGTKIKINEDGIDVDAME